MRHQARPRGDSTVAELAGELPYPFVLGQGVGSGRLALVALLDELPQRFKRESAAGGDQVARLCRGIRSNWK